MLVQTLSLNPAADSKTLLRTLGLNEVTLRRHLKKLASAGILTKGLSLSGRNKPFSARSIVFVQTEGRSLESRELGYKGNQSFASFLRFRLMETSAFEPYKRHILIEQVEVVYGGGDTDVVVFISAMATEDLTRFVENVIATLPGVRHTNTAIALQAEHDLAPQSQSSNSQQTTESRPSFKQ